MMTSPRTRASGRSSRTWQARQRHLQAMLHDRQREIRSVLQRRVGHAPPHGRGDVLDETDHAEAEVQEHIDVTLIQLKGDTLKRVTEALARIDTGEYGHCAECNGEISEKRLQALPFAVRCTACEAAHELRPARERRFGLAQRFSLAFADEMGP